MSNASTHWGVANSGTTIFLATAGTGARSTKPYDLIIDDGGDYSYANPSILGHGPWIQGSGTFDLSFAGELAPIITSVSFEFSTTPDHVLGGKCIDCIGAAIPEPATWAMMLVGFGAMGAGLRMRRRAAATA